MNCHVQEGRMQEKKIPRQHFYPLVRLPPHDGQRALESWMSGAPAELTRGRLNRERDETIQHLCKPQETLR